MVTGQLKIEVKGEELTLESTTVIVGNSFKMTGEVATYLGWGVAIGSCFLRASTTAVEASSSTTSTVAITMTVSVGAIVLKVVGTGLFILGDEVGVALGGYFTHKYIYR